MKEGIKTALVFVAGALTGACCAYYFAQKKSEDKVNNSIDEIRKYYESEADKKIIEFVDSHNTDEYDDEVENEQMAALKRQKAVSIHDVIDYAKYVHEQSGYISYGKHPEEATVPVLERELEDDTDFAEMESPRDDDEEYDDTYDGIALNTYNQPIEHEEPYVIGADEQDNYDENVMIVKFYAGNRVLTDDWDDPIDVEMVGINNMREENFTDHICYIRNEPRHLIFEVEWIDEDYIFIK